jgi:hypothetical protein
MGKEKEQVKDFFNSWWKIQRFRNSFDAHFEKHNVMISIFKMACGM